MNKKGIYIGGSGGFSGGVKEKTHKIPKGGMAAIGKKLQKRKNWTPKYSI